MTQRNHFVGTAFAALFAFSLAAHAAGFSLYPGAKVDEKATKEAQEMMKQNKIDGKAAIYTTSDAFAKVVSHYKGAKEYKMPSMGPKKTQAGQEILEAFFIFDGANDLASSKSWIKIQRPYIGKAEVKDMKVIYSDIRDVTAIVWSETK